MSTIKDGEQVDIAIIGGGISGVYTGWRLAKAASDGELNGKWPARKGDNLKIALYEGSQRIGGRLLSARPPGMPNITCEIGGMRFVSSQTLVCNLIENELKLKYHEQIVDQPSNLAYLRGKHLRFSELSQPSVLPYRLKSTEAYTLEKSQSTPAALIGWAISQLLPEAAKLHGNDLQQYLRAAMVDGTPLYQHGFWNLLARAMSPEAYAVARATIGYDALGVNANAVDLVTEYFDFTPDVKYFLLDEGYEAVPWTLQQRFTDAGGKIHQGKWLESVESTVLDDGSTGVLLQFSDGHPDVRARAAVLALPQQALRSLHRVGPVFGPNAHGVPYLLDAVEPIALYKLFVTYANPWWESAGVSQGRSLTDIPLRQCYYWGNEPSNGSAAIMVYNDISSTEFWGGLRRRPVTSTSDDDNRYPPRKRLQMKQAIARGTNVRAFERKTMSDTAHDTTGIFANRLRKNWDDHKAPHEMVAEVHRQLMSLHGVRYAPDPIDAAYMDWSDAPYGAGVHFWNTGYKSWEVLEAMTQPVNDFPCYVCGEAYSTNQTWVEGALQTAEIVLQKRFGLKAPSLVKSK